MPENDLRRALNYGPTAAARFFLALTASLQAVHIYIGHVMWVDVPLSALWGMLFTTAAIFAFWRLIDPRPNPVFGWLTNTLMCLVWSAGVVLRAKVDPATLLTPYTTMALIALWVLLRTEATSLDTRAT